jgi:tetratricopeptide (TPR) repeat protein
MIVIEELDLAVAVVRGRNLSTALKLVDDSLSRYPDSAVLHSIRGAIHFQAASQTRHDSAAQFEHLKSSLDGGRRALQLAPNSVSFARYYAQALFELAQNDAAVEYDYNAVIEACERALLLDNPTDPVEDLLGVEGMAYVDPSPVGRIEEVKKNLVNLMEESKKNKKTTLLVDEIESLQLQRRKEEIIEPSPQNHALFWPPPDDWPRIEEKRNYYKNLNITARANIKQTPDAGCSYTYEPESDPSVINFVDFFKKYYQSSLFLSYWAPYFCFTGV